MNRGNLFNLQEGEKIVEEIKPVSNLKSYWFIGNFVGLIFFCFFISMFIGAGIFAGSGTSAIGGMGLIFFFAIILALVLAWIFTSMKYEKQNYWITNKRILYMRGFVGYRISSIPFERISDVIISRTFLESVFGFGSLYIQSLAGQYSYRGGRMGAEGNLVAVPEPEKTQELIFKMVSEKRKKEKLTM
ncbi:MAG: PH domain-containing protein [archaeon]